MALDERLIGALHVEALRHDALHAEHEPHLLFQASTIDALLHGSYDGDVSFAELLEHGDFGLGTIDAVDGELIVVDGRCYRADVEGDISELDPQRRTPFAVAIYFEADTGFDVSDLDQASLFAAIDSHLESRFPCFAVRIDGSFDLVHARSVPRQSKPYRPMEQVVADQHVFDFENVDGTLIGLRFPDYAEGINVPGYHLHFIDRERKRGGHVLDLRVSRATVEIDHSSDLHMELPSGVELPAPGTIDEDALDQVEHQG
jgi:acetolactate decarboxylase